MKLYFKYLLIHFKSQLQYRTSFWLLSVGQFFIPFVVFLGVYFLFEQFGEIKGWGFFEVALCFAVIHLAFSLSECFARGFDVFSNLIVNGDFDRLLVRPRSTFLQVLGSKFEFTRVGRLLQSGFVLIWALSNLSIEWDVMKVFTLLFMVVSGIFIFLGIYMLAAAMCFWTVQGLELANIFTDGGREVAQYPLTIYQKWVTRFFTYVVPFGTVNYLPLMFILGKNEGNAITNMLIPIAGSLFIVPCFLIWQIGVRHYRSTGS
ncbi:ABC transporter permease [Neobacillus cucumis]|uniref:ABC transporter permease n=1 Tax=Neobacillus cucumis TaxID=1740721 RepID=A0A2N5H772_9BACI|nr:ABC-2 family transporter protein [Neobacillus cucumis]PLS01373.1 hypothetical protein CVD27_25415 [Neobacillus cucumis]